MRPKLCFHNSVMRPKLCFHNSVMRAKLCFHNSVMRPKDADGTTNGIEPDQAVPLGGLAGFVCSEGKGLLCLKQVQVGVIWIFSS